MAQDGTILHCLCDEGDSAWALSSEDVCYDYAWVRFARLLVACCCWLPHGVSVQYKLGEVYHRFGHKDCANTLTTSSSDFFRLVSCRPGTYLEDCPSFVFFVVFAVLRTRRLT